MKKPWIFIFISIIIVIVFCLWPKSVDFDILVSNIEIKQLSADMIEIIKESGEYECQQLDSLLVDDIVSSPDAYKEIVLDFRIVNNSDNTAMEDINIFHEFDGLLGNRIIAYDSGNADIDIYLYPVGDLAYPQGSLNLKQRILVKSSGLDNDELVKLFKDGKCKISYFTGFLSSTDGNGLYGIGRHEKSYTLNNLISKLSFRDVRPMSSG